MIFQFEKERITALTLEEMPMGYATFPRIRAGLVNISQMVIFPAFRKAGVEEAMMEALFAHLDQHDLKAVLLCPFAQQYVKKHPEWEKILPGEIHFTKY